MNKKIYNDIYSPSVVMLNKACVCLQALLSMKKNKMKNY